MLAKCLFPIVVLLMCTGLVCFPWTLGVKAKPLFTAMYVFGDSLTDPGNNLDFLITATKCNYYPYGIDFPDGPTGRFSNGKILVDFLAELVGLPVLPAYNNHSTYGKNILFGVNYASAAAGILDESGSNFGHRTPLSGQIQNFKNTLNQLSDQMEEEELNTYLTNALVVVIIGSNDYTNNLRSRLHGQNEYADLLIKKYTDYILELYNLGIRKFYLGELPPGGCTPLMRTTGHAPPGQCASSINNMEQVFNTRLKSLVDSLNLEFQDSRFVLGPTFQWFFELLNNPSTYGLKVTDEACCGTGIKNLLCLPSQIPCANRDEYLFWDFAHPTEAVNRIVAQWAYNGSSSTTYPKNILQMAQG